MKQTGDSAPSESGHPRGEEDAGGGGPEEAGEDRAREGEPVQDAPDGGRNEEGAPDIPINRGTGVKYFQFICLFYLLYY